MKLKIKMEIHKKTWPKYFQEILEGKKKVDIRLADFNLNIGDILVLEEYDPETKKYTGRAIKKKVVSITKIDPNNFSKMYKLNDIKKFGFFGIELE